MKKIKVLIIEDSTLMQELLYKFLSSDPEIEVVGKVADPLIAKELIKKANPDVLTLDIMLPHMDGITFLKNLMRLHPMPVVMISALTEKDSSIALEALSIGAVDYLAKPSEKDLSNLALYQQEVIKVVKNAAKANIAKSISASTKEELHKIINQSIFLKEEVIAIGASTGGIEAIETILMQLPEVLPPIIIVQHIKKEFSKAFSKRISKLYGFAVVEPQNYTEILPGYIYVAPADQHLIVKRKKYGYEIQLKDAPPVNGHRPSIDVLFESVANAAGPNCIGILLTGMGTDGAEGLRAIRNAKGSTIVQDKDTSVVWGMPAAAIKLDAADFIVSLNQIPLRILQIIDAKAMKLRIQAR